MSGFDLNHALFLDGVFIPGPGSDGSIAPPAPPPLGVQAWQYLSMSSDGTKMIGVAFDGYAWLSTNSGVTWTHQVDPGVKGWYSAAISDDGQVCVLAQDDGSGSLWTSQDGGGTWFEQTDPGSRDWTGCAVTADGTKAIAVSSSGDVWASTNSAVTWTAKTSIPGLSSNAVDVRYSDGGEVVIAGANAGGATTSIFLSTDHGTTFTEVAGFAGSGNRTNSVCASIDGAALYSAYDPTKFNSSANSGATWADANTGHGTHTMTGMACSDDGASIVYCAFTDGVWLSIDSGATWSDITPSVSAWAGAAMSADGMTIAVGDQTAGRIFVSTDTGASWTVGTLT